jgi:hypothetical protein
MSLKLFHEQFKGEARGVHFEKVKNLAVAQVTFSPHLSVGFPTALIILLRETRNQIKKINRNVKLLVLHQIYYFAKNCFVS